MAAEATFASYKIVAFVATAKPVRARRFYRDMLGLASSTRTSSPSCSTRMRRRYAGDCEEGGGGRIHRPGLAGPGHCAAATRLKTSGVRLQRYPGMGQDTHRIWTSPSGARVAWFKDPTAHAEHHAARIMSRGRFGSLRGADRLRDRRIESCAQSRRMSGRTLPAQTRRSNRNSGMSVRSVARSRNRNACPRSRTSVRPSAPAFAALTPQVVPSAGIASRWSYLASTAAVDLAPQPGSPG